MAVAAPFIMIGVTLLAAAGTIYQASEQAKGMKAEAAQIEDQQRLAKLEAQSEENARLERLRQTLGTQQAIAAASGYDPSRSGSFLAIQREERYQAERDIGAIRIRSRSTQYRMSLQAKGLKSGAKSTMVSSYISAGGSLLSGGYSVYDSGAFQGAS